MKDKHRKRVSGTQHDHAWYVPGLRHWSLVPCLARILIEFTTNIREENLKSTVQNVKRNNEMPELEYILKL